MIAGIAVQMTSSRVLPWIGGPSVVLLARAHAELPDREEHDRLDEHEDRDRDDHRTSQSVSIGLACFGGRRPGTSGSAAPSGDPERRRDDADDQHLRQSAARMRALGVAGRAQRPLLEPMGGGILCDARRRTSASRYAHADGVSAARYARTRRADAARRSAGASDAAARDGATRRGAEVRRGDALVAPERLGELGGLAVADAVGDLAHGQRARGEHLGRLLHPHAGQVVAEGGARRSRRRRAAAGGATRRRGGRCRRARGRRRTRARRSRRPPRRGCVRRRTVAERCMGTTVDTQEARTG